MKRFRVAEIFGPTIQGEGRNVGMPCHFIRFGGCDFRCLWCDTPHAVLPDLVAQLRQMSAYEIYHEVNHLGNDNDFIRWVVITGGNPALLDLTEVVDLLHNGHFKVMVETQGSTYRDWYRLVDDLCFSPKPPSSGMDWSFRDFGRILHTLRLNAPHVEPYLKVPVFDDLDLDFAETVHAEWPDLEMFISIGNEDPTLPTVGVPNPEIPPLVHTSLTRDVVLDKFRMVVDDILAKRPHLQDTRIFPQQHTLLWGNERGH